jgi:hypothetical protein
MLCMLRQRQETRGLACCSVRFLMSSQNGNLPVSSWNIIMPTDHRSAASS